MIKWIFIALIALIALLDYALVVACSRLEDREQYKYEQWERRQKDE